MQKLFFLLATTLLFISCFDDVSEIEDINRDGYHPEIAIPLAQGRFEFSELIGDDNENTYLTINEDNLVTFVYSGDVTSQSSLNIFDEIQLLPFTAPDSNNTVPINLMNNIEVDFAFISGGTMNVLSSNEFSEPINVELSLPELSIDGVPFKRVFGPYSPSSSILIIQDLAGIRIDLTNNEMDINIVAILPDGSRRELPDNTAGVLRNMTFSYVEGYWSYEEIPMDQDTIEIEVFETLRRGDMRFEEPVVTVNLKNSFGFPVRSDIKALELYTLDGGTFEVESPYVTDGFDIEYPREVGEFAITTFDFNKDNSNLPDVTSVKPLALFYDMYAIANPDRDTTITGFMTDSSEIVVQVVVVLPLKGSAQDFEARDTIDFELPTFDSGAEILNGEFKMIFESTIPVAMDVQAIIVDENNNIIDSLLPEGLVIEGFDENASANSDPTKTIKFVQFDTDRYDKWKQGKKIHLVAHFSSENYPNSVEITPDQFLDLKIGLKAEITNL